MLASAHKRKSTREVHMVQFGRQVHRRFGTRGLVIGILIAAALLAAGGTLLALS